MIQLIADRVHLNRIESNRYICLCNVRRRVFRQIRTFLSNSWLIEISFSKSLRFQTLIRLFNVMQLSWIIIIEIVMIFLIDELFGIVKYDCIWYHLPIKWAMRATVSREQSQTVIPIEFIRLLLRMWRVRGQWPNICAKPNIHVANWSPTSHNSVFLHPHIALYIFFIVLRMTTVAFPVYIVFRFNKHVFSATATTLYWK